MPKDLIISKQNIIWFLPLNSDGDIDGKTWKKEVEWNKDCSTGQEAERNKVINEPFMHYFYLDGFFLSATGAAYHTI